MRLKNPWIAIAVSFGYLTSFASADEPRLWTSKNGKYTVEAKLIAVSKDAVELERKDTGKTLTVKVEDLSEADSAYIAEYRARAILAPSRSKKGSGLKEVEATLNQVGSSHFALEPYFKLPNFLPELKWVIERNHPLRVVAVHPVPGVDSPDRSFKRLLVSIHPAVEQSKRGQFAKTVESDVRRLMQEQKVQKGTITCVVDRKNPDRMDMEAKTMSDHQIGCTTFFLFEADRTIVLQAYFNANGPQAQDALNAAGRILKMVKTSSTGQDTDSETIANDRERNEGAANVAGGSGPVNGTGFASNPGFNPQMEPPPDVKKRLEEHRARYEKMMREAMSNGDAPSSAPAKSRVADAPKETIQLDRIANSIGMQFVRVPKGTFMMGSPVDEKGRNEEPLHEVTITKDYYLGVVEVTQEQFERLLKKNPSEFKSPNFGLADTSNHPVEGVSWADAMAFCKALSELPEEKAAGRVYRLPTEAEWEYACRAGTSTPYSFGSDAKLLGEYEWFDDNSAGRTHPVGTKKPNRWGLYDMHGNVIEWCSDDYGDYGTNAAIDPTGSRGNPEERVVRGGSWARIPEACRSAFRIGYKTSLVGTNAGLRVAFSVTESEDEEIAEKE